MEVFSVACLRDNYAYVLCDGGGRAVVVDPGEAEPVVAALRRGGLRLSAVLITHRHADHVGGVEGLLAAAGEVPVFAPDGCGIARATRCADGDYVPLFGDKVRLRVAATPGHTLEHVVFWGEGLLFSGDTLFAGGCGRVFEGTMAQMFESLKRLAALPAETRVFFGHEYTVANLRFAAAVEPDNAAVAARLRAVEETRAAGGRTVPSTIACELETNPFLRTGVPAVAAAVARREGGGAGGEAAVFAALRRWKDVF